MALIIFNRSYRILAYKFFHKFGLDERIASNFESLKPALKKAQLFMTLEEYISTILFTIMLTMPFIFIIARMILVSTYGFEAVPAFIMAFIIAAVYAAGVFLIFTLYPEYQVDIIKRDIERNLPYATTHMATIAGTGVPTYLVLKIIGDFTEYGELAKECRKMSRNIELFGYDTLTAMSETAADTPSMNFKDLLWSVVSVIRSGGDMRQLLVEKARIYMENQKNMESEYLDTLELMAEMYTTIFVAGPILFVVMVTIIGSLGALPFDLALVFSIFIYLLMPLMAIGFMIMIDSSKPMGE